jgi:hypothetical protein
MRSGDMATSDDVKVGVIDIPADDYDVGAAFGDHAVEWWVHDGTRLVPATPEQAALLSRLHDRAPLPARHHPRRWRAFAGRLLVAHARQR